MPSATASGRSAPSARCGSSASTPRCVPFGLNYSRFIAGLDKAGITVDRKVLSDLAIHEPAAFQAIVGRPRPRFRHKRVMTGRAHNGSRT